MFVVANVCGIYHIGASAFQTSRSTYYVSTTTVSLKVVGGLLITVVTPIFTLTPRDKTMVCGVV